MLKIEFIKVNGGYDILRVTQDDNPKAANVHPEVALSDHNYISPIIVQNVPLPQQAEDRTKESNPNIQSVMGNKRIINLKALYNCKICGYSTLSKESMDYHTLCHKPKTKKKLLAKLNEEASEQIDSGTYCPCCYMKKLQIPINPNGMINCPYCSFFTTKVYSLNRHIRIHQNQSDKCTECPFRGVNMEDLILHSQPNHKLDAEFLARFEEHVRVKNGKKPYCCKHCKFATKFPKNMERHLKRHLDNKTESLS